MHGLPILRKELESDKRARLAALGVYEVLTYSVVPLLRNLPAIIT